MLLDSLDVFLFLRWPTRRLVGCLVCLSRPLFSYLDSCYYSRINPHSKPIGGGRGTAAARQWAQAHLKYAIMSLVEERETENV